MSRVRIGTCSGPADAALVRSVFQAHGIHAVVGAENHASMLGGLGGSFLSLDISVDEGDAEQAVALLRDIREGDHEAPHDAAEHPSEVETDAGTSDRFGVDTSSADADDAEDADHNRAASSIDIRVNRRRRTIVVLFLAFCVSFGTAHMFTRAWLRGMALAGIEVLGFTYLNASALAAALLIMGAIVTDAVGALARVWAQPKPTIPSARVRNA